MKIEKINDNVWKFKGRTCVYLLKQEKSWIMIDAGDSSECDKLRDAIEKIVSLDEIDFVLLTHLHYDHVGCVGLFPNAKVFASGEEVEDYRVGAREFHYFAGEVQDDILKRKLEVLPGTEVRGKNRQDQQNNKYLELEQLKQNSTQMNADERGFEDERNRFEELGLEVLSVPGHTRGSVAFLDRRLKLLFSGDTIFAGEIVGRTDLGNSVPGEMGRSVGMLRGLEREGFRVLAGHGY